MKLSTYIQKLKIKGVPEDWALGNAKAVVKKVGARWTTSKQKLFDEIWAAKVPPIKKLGVTKVATPSIEMTKPRQLSERGQGGTGEQRLKFLMTLLTPCKFTKTEWSKYGLHAIKTGSEKRPANFKMALDLLVKTGFTQDHRMPMSSDFSDLRSARAVTFYSDKYGNSINTVSQKSENGKNDFYILNVTPKLTQVDKNKLSDIEAKLNEKYKQALEQAEQGKIKSKPRKDEPYELTLKEFIKKMKTNNSVREARITPEEIQEQWVLAIEQALKEGKKLKPEIQTEYTQYAKATGAVYKLPVGGKKYLAITLDPDKVLRIKRNLKRGKDVTVKSDSGQRFVLTTTEPDSGVACGPTLKIALGAKVLYAVKL